MQTHSTKNKTLQFIIDVVGTTMLNLKTRTFLFIPLIYSTTHAFSQDFEPKSGTLFEVNKLFHVNYNILVKQTIDKLGDDKIPVLIFIGDSVVLKHNYTRSAKRVIPLEYHLLKAMDHLALSIFVTLSQFPQAQLSDQNIASLISHKVLADSLLNNIKSLPLNEKTTSRQTLLLNKCTQFLTKLIVAKSFELKERNTFAKDISNLLMANTDDAAKIELKNLHKQVQIWLKEMNQETVKNLYVVVGSSHQARYKALAVQYFDKILHERTGSTALTENKLVFAEAVYDEKGCLSVLARHIIDQEIGLRFFNDRYRMQKDLLSESASEYLKVLFPLSKKK